MKKSVSSPRTRARLMFLAVLVSCIGCDHAAKRIAVSALGASERVSLLASTVQFELAWNPGAFLSLGSDLPHPFREILLIGVVPLLVLVSCVVVLRTRGPSRALLFGLALVTGGGLANWLDRLLHAGTVTDFVSLGVGGLRTGVFNLADVAIFAGIGVLLLHRRRPGAVAGADAEDGG